MGIALGDATVCGIVGDAAICSIVGDAAIGIIVGQCDKRQRLGDATVDSPRITGAMAWTGVLISTH